MRAKNRRSEPVSYTHLDVYKRQVLDFLCKESYDLRDFVALVSYLRSPNGCPWDQVQTHESIRRNFLEETYEACEAIDAGDLVHMREELGDVLMQVLLSLIHISMLLRSTARAA